MIICKTPREIEIMRQAGKIVAIAHHEVSKYIKPGISLAELDTIVEQVIRSCEATPSFKGYNGFPASSCISVNQVIVHGIPDEYRLQDGDIVTIDIGAYYKGYHGDSAWTYAVGSINEEKQHLLEVTEQSLYEGLKLIAPGVHLSDISHAIQMHVEKNGCSIVKEFTGHGIGQDLHEEPNVPNYGNSGKGVILKPGMTLAIEPIVCSGQPISHTLEDNWTTVTVDASPAAHYEHTIVVTESGYDILTIL